MDNAFAYGQAYGIQTQDKYPYTATDNMCSRKSTFDYIFNGYTDVIENDEAALLTAISM